MRLAVDDAMGVRLSATRSRSTVSVASGLCRNSPVDPHPARVQQSQVLGARRRQEESGRAVDVS